MTPTIKAIVIETFTTEIERLTREQKRWEHLATEAWRRADDAYNSSLTDNLKRVELEAEIERLTREVKEKLDWGYLQNGRAIKAEACAQLRAACGLGSPQVTDGARHYEAMAVAALSHIDALTAERDAANEAHGWALAVIEVIEKERDDALAELETTEGAEAALAVVHAHYGDPANVTDGMALAAGKVRHGSNAGFERETIGSYRLAIAAAMKAAKEPT
jgi:hypothetical protein